MASKKPKTRKKSQGSSSRTSRGQRSSCQTNGSSLHKRVPGNHGNKRVITEEREPWLWRRIASGKDYQSISVVFKEEFGERISKQAIWQYHILHMDRYRAYLENFKEVRLANRKARLIELQNMVEKLRDKIDGILEMTARESKEAGLSSLLMRFNELMAQLHEQSGDKKAKDEGSDHQHFIQIINHIPGVLADVASTSQEHRNRISGN